MTLHEALDQFRSIVRNAHALQHAIGVLSYDAMTVAPADSPKDAARPSPTSPACSMSR